jgi:hypothetical protein
MMREIELSNGPALKTKDDGDAIRIIEMSYAAQRQMA